MLTSLENTGNSSSLKQLSMLRSWLILSIANSTALRVNISHSLRSLFESGEQGKNPRKLRGCLTSSEVQLSSLYPSQNIVTSDRTDNKHTTILTVHQPATPLQHNILLTRKYNFLFNLQHFQYKTSIKYHTFLNSVRCNWNKIVPSFILLFTRKYIC